jgi:putative membrane protein insertion efficiency factor
LILLFLWLYQKTVSPWLPPCCRFTPSCSHYAIEAIKTHGVCKGILLCLWRLGRCQPFCKSGYDPVPPVGVKLFSKFWLPDYNTNRESPIQ